jgi:hypothetical protein
MISEYFYHGIIKSATLGFGTLFNNIYIQKKDSDGDVTSVIKVPIKYGPTQKFLARLDETPTDLNKPLQITLPRMSFEMTSLMYDSRRKATTTTYFLTHNQEGDQIKKTFLPVPYQISYNLYIMSKLTDDVWQILEQIIPYFTPSHTLTLNVVSEINENRDINYTLNSIDVNEDYEGDFSERVTFIYTLAFTADVWFFKPVISGGLEKEIIEKVAIGFVAGGPGSTNEDITYSIGPKAIKSYSNTIVTTLTKDLSLTEFTLTVNDSSNIDKGDLLTIDDETMLVLESNPNNTVVVRRGEYGSIITNHVLGTNIKILTTQDNLSIKYGDEFGLDNIILE